MGGYGICRAEGCAQGFVGDEAFDMHRVGTFGKTIYNERHTKAIGFGKPERRCLTVDEMLELGMVLNKKGWWTKGTATRTKRQEYLESKHIDADDMPVDEEPVDEEEDTADVS
jgi:hypothetical protein